MIEEKYTVQRNEIAINGLYAFLMNDQIGLILYEAENMGSPNAKMIKATRLLLVMCCPELLPEAGVSFMPNKGSVLFDDAAKLCAGEFASLPEVQKAVFSDPRLISSGNH
jgi:hypothetical protein